MNSIEVEATAERENGAGRINFALPGASLTIWADTTVEGSERNLEYLIDNLETLVTDFVNKAMNETL